MDILVRGTNWIGDAVMTIPALRKLRRMFPAARITLQSRPWAEGIFRESGLFDDVITTGSFVDQVRTLRKRKFDLAVVLPNSFESALAARLGGASRIFGFASDRRSLLLSDPIAIPEWKNDRHEVYYYLELINSVELAYHGEITEASEVEPVLRLSDEIKARGREILEAHGVVTRVIALAPGSTNSEAKRWHAESFARLSDLLQTESGTKVVLLGSNEERDVTGRVAELVKIPLVDLTGETNISEAAAVLSHVDLLISNDMGLAHLAPAVGTRTIVIFGPTNPVTTGPLSDRAEIITANVECAPCMLRRCPIDHRCMTRISPEAVYERARSNLMASK